MLIFKDINQSIDKETFKDTQVVFPEVLYKQILAGEILISDTEDTHFVSYLQFVLCLSVRIKGLRSKMLSESTRSEFFSHLVRARVKICMCSLHF